MVVKEYVDEVVSRTRRTVHVVDSAEAAISFWHGGRLVADGGCYTSVEAGVREAVAVARRFGVTAESSLHVRVRETVTRRFRVVRPGSRDADYPDYEQGEAARSACVARRHVWDSHAGPLPARSLCVGFEVVQWIGFRDEACDPGGQLAAYFTAAEVEMDGDDLWPGFGHGAAVLTGFRREARAPAHIERPRPVSHWAMVVLAGTCEVFVPPRAGDADVAAFLGRCDVDVHLSRDVMGTLPNRWDHYTGRPAASLRWVPPEMPALPAPAAAGGRP